MTLQERVMMKVLALVRVRRSKKRKRMMESTAAVTTAKRSEHGGRWGGPLSSVL